MQMAQPVQLITWTFLKFYHYLVQYSILSHHTKKNTINMIHYCLSICIILFFFWDIICKTRTVIYKELTEVYLVQGVLCNLPSTNYNKLNKLK